MKPAILLLKLAGCLLLAVFGYYVISAVGCAFANSVGVFIAARVIGGIGIGISTVAAPLYISEIAPPRSSKAANRSSCSGG